MKILIRGTNWIGDAVMTIPAIKAVRRIFPSAEITLQSRPGAADVFVDADYIDHLIIPENAGSAISNTFSQAKELRTFRFDLGILLTNSFESALVHKLASITRRFGYRNDGRGFLLTDAIDQPAWKSQRHEVHYYLELIAELGRRMTGEFTEQDTTVEITVSDQRKDEANKFLNDLGIDMSKKIVALGAGSTNSRAKRWPALKYAALADLLHERTGANLLMVGSSGDNEVAAEVLKSTTAPIIDLTGKTTVAAAIAILSQTDLLISNDMGLAHAAPAVGTRTIVIFGPTNPETTRPFSDLTEIINKHVECSPCMLRDCPIDHRCMERVSVEEVFSQAKNYLT